jgi:hypothetical protein
VPDKWILGIEELPQARLNERYMEICYIKIVKYIKMEWLTVPKLHHQKTSYQVNQMLRF